MSDAKQKNETPLLTTNIEKALGDFIYLKKDMAPFFAVPFAHLYGVVCDICDESPDVSGIPSELVSKKDMSLEGPSIKYKEDKDTVYLLSADYGTKEDALNIIKLFNRLMSIRLTIYVPVDMYDTLKGFANDNITIVGYDDIGEVTITTNLLITYGYCARNPIRQKVPTLVVGPHGFGGWVTPENIGFLFKDGFRGRPNGRLDEITPLEVLVDELMEIKECEGLRKLLNKNANLLKGYLERLPTASSEKNVAHFKNVHAQLIDSSKRNVLRPKLASNVDMVRNENEVLVQRKEINDILFSLNRDELGFLEDLKGLMTCRKLQEKYEMENGEFWDIMIALWERKAIVF